MTLIDYIKPLLDDVLADEPMSRHTSFRIGGPGEVVARPTKTEEFIAICEVCKKHNFPLTVLGDGANVLVSDEGISGVVVITNKMKDIELLEGSRIRAQCGARMSAVAEAAAKTGLSGLAFASGIPGTIGGGIYMNAGAYGHSISDFCASVTVYRNGETIEIPVSDMGFGYRESIIQKKPALILSAVFQLNPGDTTQIREEMKDINSRRRVSQPLEYPSAGSTFKRPEGYYAGKLIQDSGLKGFFIGGAEVSEKHAGFIINKGNATAKDVRNLVEHVRKKVHEDSGVWLEPEVRFI